jgi:hypothetical protein
MLLTDVDTPAGNNIESLDRVTTGSVTASGDAAGTMDMTGTSTASGNYGQLGDADMYSISAATDRTTTGWARAEVSTSGVKGTNRTLSLDHFDEMFRKIWVRGGNPKVMLTGYDTLMRLQQLLQSQQRFMEEKRVVPTYNGVKGVPGMEAGFIVATYNGVPIIPSKDVEADGISRVYMLDTDYLYYSTAKPTQYFESGIETGDPFAINRLGQEGLYRTMGEVWTTFFGGQGSIRDLQ